MALTTRLLDKQAVTYNNYAIDVANSLLDGEPSSFSESKSNRRISQFNIKFSDCNNLSELRHVIQLVGYILLENGWILDYKLRKEKDIRIFYGEFARMTEEEYKDTLEQIGK